MEKNEKISWMNKIINDEVLSKCKWRQTNTELCLAKEASTDQPYFESWRPCSWRYRRPNKR